MPAESQPSMRKFGDYDATRSNIYSGALTAVQSLPPVENSRYRISFGDVGYAGPEVPSYAAHKQAMLEGRTLSRRLTGTVTLTDKATNTPVDSRRMTIASVPMLTRQGVFVADGSAMAVAHQLRLLPGLYARKKSNGRLEVHTNLLPGTGVSHRVELDPESGVFKTTVGQAEIPTIGLLRILGATTEELRNTWGDELYARNAKAEKPHHVDRYWEKMGPPGPVPDGTDKAKVLADRITKYPLDPWVSRRTLGKPFDRYGKDPLLLSTGKLLSIARGEAEPDDRDDPIYSVVMGPEHLIAERLSRSGPLLSKLLWQATNAGNLKRVQPGFLSPSIRSLFLKSGLALIPEGTNAAEFVDHGARITKVGEGGIGKSADSVPFSARNIHARQFGYIDPVKATECFDAETQVMTFDGWKPWPEVTESDRFACVVDGRLVFERAQKLHVSDYKGTMYGAKNLLIDYLVTPDHRFWCALYASRAEQVWRWRTAKEIHNRTEMHRVAGFLPYIGDPTFTDYELPTVEAHVPELVGLSETASRRTVGARRIKNREPLPISPFCELLGWYLGEGCFTDRNMQKGTPYLVRISQSKTANPENCDRIGKVLTELGIPWTYQNREADGGGAFHFTGKQWVKYFKQFGYSGDRFIPEEVFSAPVEARRRLYDALMLAEATRNRQGRLAHFNTTSPRMARDFARLAFSLGYSTSTSVYVDRRKETYLDVHIVTVHARDQRLVNHTRKSGGKLRPGDHYTVEYDGKVYCATVPGGMLYVRRRDGSGMWTGNSESVGVDLRVAFGTRLGTDNRLYAPLRDAKTGKIVFRSIQDTADKVVGFPSTLTSPDPVVPVIHDGRLTYAPKAKVDYILPSMEQSFSPLSNMSPLKSAGKAHRASMAGRMISQSLPLVDAEAPLVRSQVPGQAGKSFEELYGPHMGAVFARRDQPGTVTAVDKDSITVQYADGKTVTHERYNDLPAGRKTAYSTAPLVQVGAQVAPGQILAKSNYTDAKGHAAYGRSLRVGFMNLKGRAYEDAIAVSESAAKKLTSDHMYRHDVYADPDTLISKAAHAAAFPGTHPVETLKSVDDDGVVKVGTQVKKGDPLVLAVRRRQNLFGRLSRSGKAGLSDASETWEYDEPGVVTDAVRTPNGPVVLVKTQKQLKEGDKLCYDPDTEVLTASGWKPVADVRVTDLVASLNPETHEIEYVVPSAVHTYEHSGRMYRLAATQYDLLVTDNHNLFVNRRFAGEYDGTYRLAPPTEIFGKRFRMKRNGVWKGETPTHVVLDGTTVRAGQSGNGTRDVPDLHVPTQTYAMLLGMFISEGNLIDHPESGSYGFDVTQIKEPNRQQMLDALDVAGIRYTVCSGGEKIRIYSLLWLNHFRQLGTKAHEKRLPSFVYEWGVDALQTLFKWLMWGDGSSTIGGRPKAYFTTSPGLADDVQRLALHLGISANVELLRDAGQQEIKGQVYDCQAFYRVAIYSSKNEPEVNHSHAKSQDAFTEQWEPYTGPVHCVTLTRNHVLYVRRNGKPVWCGNSGRHGNKGVAVIVPDHQMPVDERGNPLEVVISSLGVISRANPNSKYEALLGKIAEKTGQPYVVNDWDDTGSGHHVGRWVRQELARNGLKAKETLTDPETGRKISNVLTGTTYLMKLHHISEAKVKGRGLGGYDESGQPLRGQSGKAMRASLGDTNALLSHGATDVIHDAHAYRGQDNPEFWLQYMSGFPPTRPATSKPFERFLTELRGSGIDPVAKGGRYHLTALTQKRVDELAGDRVVKNGETLDFSRNGEPVAGGLFDHRIFGTADSPTQWAKIPLHEPVLNPVMEDGARRLLGLTEKQFRDTIAGRHSLPRTGTGMGAILTALSAIDVPTELARVREQAASSRKTVREEANRKLFYLKGLERQGQSPKDWVLNAVPVLPPGIRPVSAGGPGGSLIVSDANLLYADLLQANNVLRDLSTEVDDVGAERLNLYDAAKAVTGLGDPVGAKNRERGVKGVLGRLLGDSAKLSYVQQKLLGTPVNLSGRGQVVPNPDLDIDQIGLPESLAREVYHPFVVRRLVRGGMSRVEAAREVDAWGPRARAAMGEEMEVRPALATRYPALHRYNVMAFRPVLVKGDAIHTNALINKGYNLDHNGDSVSTLLTTVLVDGKVYLGDFETFVRRYVVDDYREDQAVEVFGNQTTVFCFKPGADIRVPAVMHDGSTGWYPVKNISIHTSHGPDCYRVETASGLSSVFTAHHNFLKLSPQCELMPAYTSEVAPGDLLPSLLSEEVPFEADTYDGTVLDYETGVWFGHWLGDGGIAGSDLGTVSHASLDPDMLMYLEPIAAKVWPFEPLRPWYEGNRHSVRWSNAGFASWMIEQFGHLQHTRRVPGWALSAPKEFRRGLIVGYCLAEGHAAPGAVVCESTSRLLLLGMKMVAATLGIYASIANAKPERPSPDGTKTYKQTWTVNFNKRRMIAARLPWPSVEKSTQFSEMTVSDIDRSGHWDVVPFPPAVSDVILALRRSRVGPAGAVFRAIHKITETAPPSKDVKAYAIRGSCPRRFAETLIRVMGLKLPETPTAVQNWVKLVEATHLIWEPISSVTRVERPDVTYDFSVEGAETFCVDGFFLTHNTMTVSIPLSDESVREAYAKLLPSRNLYNPATYKTGMFNPNMEHVQGLHAASTLDENNPPVEFRTRKDAIAARIAGKIGMGTRIRILEDEA